MSLIEKALEKANRKKDGGKSALPEQVVEAVNAGAEWTPLENATGKQAGVTNEDKSVKSVSINTAFLQLNGMVTPESGFTEIAQQFRRIKQPILKRAFAEASEKNSNVVAVTSTGSNEGKSFVCMNLAVSIAMELDRTVLLVDADAFKGAITRDFCDFEEEPAGLQDLIAGSEKNIADLMLKTDINRLTLLPAGTVSENVAEHLSSSNMKEIIREISSRYSNRLIIVDCPPISAGSEATILADLAGQIVFVVEAEKTTIPKLEEALKQVDKNKITGLILNKSNQRDATDLYSEYGAYGSYGARSVSARDKRTPT